jgi:hypothetical protein
LISLSRQVVSRGHIQNLLNLLDSPMITGNDKKERFQTFYAFFNL